MVSISFSDSSYPNHIALVIDFVGSSVHSTGFFTEKIHSANRGHLIVELVKKHGKVTDFGWKNGFYFRAEVSDKVLNLIRRLVNMKRNMTEKLYEELEAKLDDLDGFEATLAPYVIAEQLTPFGGY
jgi:hypothetical protein